MGLIPPKVEVCEGFSLGGFLEEEFFSSTPEFNQSFANEAHQASRF